MATQQIAWAVNGNNNISIVYPDYQSPSYTNDEWNLADLTISAGKVLMVLSIEQGDSYIYHTPETFPMTWFKGIANLDAVATEDEKKERMPQVVKIDANPDNDLYMVLNNGKLAKATWEAIQESEAEEESEIVVEIVKGIENVMQVSAAPNGWVWVVAADPTIGSVVKWMNPENGEWNLVPNFGQAARVTGGIDGNAFVIDSAGTIFEITEEKELRIIPFWGSATQLSVGPENLLWIISGFPSESSFGGSYIYHTKDGGLNWECVEDSGAIYLDAGLVDMKAGLLLESQG